MYIVTSNYLNKKLTLLLAFLYLLKSNLATIITTLTAMPENGSICSY